MTPSDDERRKFEAEIIKMMVDERMARAEQAETPIDIPFGDAPCGHPGQYCWTEDGGKHIVCLLCEFKKAAAAPVEDRPAPTRPKDVSTAGRLLAWEDESTRLAPAPKCGNEFALKHGYFCELPKGHDGDHEAECPNPQFHQSWPQVPVAPEKA